jgi:GntP family gluconate:H+ symporter
MLIYVLIALLVIVGLTYKKWLHPIFAILLGCFVVGLPCGASPSLIIRWVNTGFGEMLGNIGLIILLGSMVGILLERSGAAASLASFLVGISGKKNAQFALMLTGSVVGIPVFCDSGFILLAPLAKRIAQTAKQPAFKMLLGLAGGLYTTHNLIPPTPGPVAAIANLGVQEVWSTIFLLGLPVSLVSIGAVFIFLKVLPNKHLIAEEHLAVEQEAPTMPPWKACIPIVLPIALIAIGNVTVVSMEGQKGILFETMAFFSKPLAALGVGYFVSLLMYAPAMKADVVRIIPDAMLQAAPVLFLTGAGGALGYVIKSCGLEQSIRSIADIGLAQGPLLLLFGFLLTAMLKTAQGSSTAAIIISSAILQPFLSMAGYHSPFQVSLLVLALGAGAMVVSHTNDSFYWVIKEFSGLRKSTDTYEFTWISLVQGLASLFAVLLLYAVLI